MKSRHTHSFLSLCILLLALALVWPSGFLISTARSEGAGASYAEADFEPGFIGTPGVEVPRSAHAAAVGAVATPGRSAAVDPATRYAEIASKIDAIIKKPLYRAADWGVDIRSLEDDSPIFVHDNDRLFSPASNLKLFTTSAALDRLGPDFRFLTQVAYEGSLGPDHRLTGNLILFGRGDPDLSGAIRTVPNQFANLDAMAQKVRGFGITEVDGDIIGDDSYFTFAPYGEGWMPSDLVRDYGAPVSALSFNNNVITPGLRSFRVKDPALYTARLLRERLIRTGIRVKGISRARHAGDDLGRLPSHLVCVHESPPLLDIIAYTNKRSQNLYAEILLRTLGAQVKGVGSDQAGLEAIHEFLAEAGITAADARLYDGSGLSRYNLITPRAETLLLAHIASKPYFSDFVDTLAISGLDGTLRGRMVRGPGFLRVFAKTGSLQNVTTLGGYIRTNSGKMVSFSILNNNHSYSANTARRAIDQICNLLTEL